MRQERPWAFRGAVAWGVLQGRFTRPTVGRAENTADTEDEVTTKPSYQITSMKTVGVFMNGRACSDTLFHVLNRAYGHPSTLEERAVMPMAGGLMQHGYQCGMLWGAALAAGAQAHRLFGPTPRAEAKAIVATQRLVDRFRSLNNETDCVELTNIDKSSSTLQMVTFFLIKGGTIKCFRMAARYAPEARRAIDDALTEDGEDGHCSPVSCAAMLARKVGASEQHAVTVAGLAGGIGLTGGACGALGAAIWLVGLRSLEAGASKLDFESPRAAGVIERFLACTNYEFECSKIVGRGFKDVTDHASNLRDGGCAKVIHELAAAFVGSA